jgi:hypothetical protein
LNEANPFGFESRFGKFLNPTCNDLGKRILNFGMRGLFNNNTFITRLAKATSLLTEDDRNKIWKGPRRSSRVLCTYPIKTEDQANLFKDYFEQYADERLKLPYYDGVLCDVLLREFSKYWTLRKTGFDLCCDRKPSEIRTAQSMVDLVAKGGEFQRVVYFNSEWEHFELATQYSVRVGESTEKRHVIVYSIVYRKVGTRNQ